MKRSRQQVVAFENLEGRQLMSGHHAYHASVHHMTVRHHRIVAPPAPTPAPAPVVAPTFVSDPLTVTTNGSTLNITGTPNNNQIVVTQSGSTFTISNGSWNTTITGSFNLIVVKGNGGNDSIRMDASVTVPAMLYGGSGTDTLIGSNANDTFYAGSGVNTMVGGSGNDTFVTIGSVGDTITGGAGSDSFWMDNSSTEVVTDLSAAESAAGHVHRVGSFINGASKTLSGGAIADPKLTDPSMVYKSFANDPLFAAGGPSENDINQGYLGDCYFLSALSATAKVNPDRIMQSIVSLGDGTFAVQMRNGSGQVGFVRLDADLATWGAGGPMAYASLGTGNSLWAAMMEKAFTYFHSGATPTAPTYATIDNGGWMNESFNALGASNTDIYGSTASQLISQLTTALNAGEAVTIGIANVPSGAPLIGDHAYTVDHVNRDSHGNVVSVTLRNPWGVDGAGNDGANDGYVTVTVAQLFAANMGGVAARV